jgi:hypothetical protein
VDVELHLAEFHKDVYVFGRFGEVDELDDVGMIDFVPDLDLCLDPFNYVLLKLHLGIVVALLFGNLTYNNSTCLSN